METLKEYIKAGVDSMIRESSEKEHRKDLAEQAKERFDIKSSDFTYKIRVAYDTAEAIDKKMKLEEAIEEVTGYGF